MSVRRNTTNRLNLIRSCGICGKVVYLTADTPWVRQIPRDGKKQATTYFCSEKCFASSYKHIGWYDGKADLRREEREKKRDRTEQYARYRAENREAINQRRMERYWKNREEELENNRYYRKKRKLKEQEALS